MRLVNRPGFLLIALLLGTLILLTAYLLWKLPVAEQLTREKRASAPKYEP
jgi:hypothetical protein